MVIDFGDLKKIVKENILDKYDHALVLNENAPYSKSEVISNEFEKVILAPYQPTCENLMLDFVSILNALFVNDIKLVSVMLEETPTSHSVWEKGDNSYE
jgi:6-pyruvoyltetrahydropterin/6-carboxytetrahydropterin synthase